MFETVEGKRGHRWWTWAFVTADTVFYRAEYVRSRHGVEPAWADEAVEDDHAVWLTPDPASRSGKCARSNPTEGHPHITTFNYGWWVGLPGPGMPTRRSAGP